MAPWSIRPEILFERRGAAGIVTLNRPQALNAVTHAMVRALTRQLGGMGGRSRRHPRDRHGRGRARVLGRRRPARALRPRAGRPLRGGARLLARRIPAQCADQALPQALRRADRRHRHGRRRRRLGARLAPRGRRPLRASPCPRSASASFPDVGATWFLPRLPGELGTYCALTGERLDAADAVATGVATHRVPSARFPICSTGSAARCRSMRCSPPLPSRPGQGPWRARPAIDRLFTGRPGRGHPGRRSTRRRGQGADAGFARAAAASIRLKSPTSLKVALAQLRRGRELDFDECMRTEFRIVSRIVRGHDLYEGYER